MKGSSNPASPRTARPRSAPSNRGVAGWIRKHMSVGRGTVQHAAQSGAPQLPGEGEGHGDMPDIEVADVFESSEYSMTDYEMESTGDLA